MSYKVKDIIAEENGFAVVKFGKEYHILANGIVGAVDFEAYGDKSLAEARMTWLASRGTGREMCERLERRRRNG